jgi:hypothetical protein
MVALKTLEHHKAVISRDTLKLDQDIPLADLVDVREGSTMHLAVLRLNVSQAGWPDTYPR